MEVYMLEVRNLKKSFGDVVAVDDISFVVPKNCIFGLIGRNGAGKTTTIRMAINILQPDEGEVLFNGKKIDETFKEILGYLPEERGLYKKMTVWDTIIYFAELKGKKAREVEKKAKEYLNTFELIDKKNLKIEALSKGNQQKVQIITSILHDPEILILDEPFSGLDPINVNLLRKLIVDFKKQGKTIVLSTHIMDLAEKICDYIGVIHKGKLLESGQLKSIKEKYGNNQIIIYHQDDISFLKNLSFVDKYEEYGNFTSVRVSNKNFIKDVFQLLAEKNIFVEKFIANEVFLQEIFVELIGSINQNKNGGDYENQ